MAFLVGAFIILFLTITSYAQHGTILNPKSGTKIAPGSQFNFTYMGRADYGVSSYSFHVWLLGEQILNDNPTTNDSYTYGWFFGRFDYPNWPGEHPVV